MSSSIPFTTQSNADSSKCFKWRKWPVLDRNGRWRKRGAKKIYWWVISQKCLQDKYQKYNFIGEDWKVLKTWKLVYNFLKAWQLQHLNVNLFCALDSL